jgi:hypothetical protein
MSDETTVDELDLRITGDESSLDRAITSSLGLLQRFASGVDTLKKRIDGGLSKAFGGTGQEALAFAGATDQAGASVRRTSESPGDPSPLFPGSLSSSRQGSCPPSSTKRRWRRSRRKPKMAPRFSLRRLRVCGRSGRSPPEPQSRQPPANRQRPRGQRGPPSRQHAKRSRR